MKEILKLDGKGYKAYRELKGKTFTFRGIKIKALRIQADPFAPPSVFLLEAPSPLPEGVPYEDWLHRRLYERLKRYSKKRGEGRSGYLGLPRPSNAMLRRSSIKIEGGKAKAKIWLGLPSRRRRVLAEEAVQTVEGAARAFEEALKMREGVKRHVKAWIIQEEVRAKLKEMGLVTFVGNGSILPRACGGCEEPLEGAVPFESPPGLKVEIETSEGVLEGMGIKKGVNLILGSAFQGKSTLLDAIVKGVWNHVPGDGRERVVTIKESMFILSEDGRRVRCVDISPFLKMEGAECFTTDNASGMTSAAAYFQEAVEAGAEAILIDEDYVATNFLYFDEFVDKLIRKRTNITISEVGGGIREKGISVIIAGSGNKALLEQSDVAIIMEDYKPREFKGEGKKLRGYSLPKQRILRKVRRGKVRLRGNLLYIDDFYVNLSTNKHLVESGQLNTIAALIYEFEGMSFREIAKAVDELDLWKFPTPALSEIRGLDLIHVLNKLPISVERK